MERLLEKQPNLPGPRLVQSVENQHESVTSIATLSPRQAASVISAADQPVKTVKKAPAKLEERTKNSRGWQRKGQVTQQPQRRTVKPITVLPIPMPVFPSSRSGGPSGKARKLNYHCSLAVDTAEGVISHVQADFADGRDSQNLPDITLKLQQRLAHNELRLEEILADTGYSNSANYALLEGWNITGWIPVFGHYKSQIEGFSYHPQADHFTCSVGKHLVFKTFDKNEDGGWLKVYRAAYQDCQQCPLKSSCVPKRWSATAAMPPNYSDGL
ncbi:transposase [Spirosoma aerolatum]|uniref:transposase n=1 Tax=Spirosoma aerolatum TaxID=1211326 RepID=UPI001FE9E611|nr:transposase [Spirosoma aerolatum]